MKLANALSQRAELQTRIHQLEARLYNNAQVQEGEQPAEDPRELLRELEEDYVRLEALISAINRTNNAARTEDGATLSDLLARRDCLRGKLGILRNFLDNASALVRRRTAGEIKVKSSVNVRELQKQVDGLSKELRQLEETIQEKNWTTELLSNE
ncbi:DIP1984 family protein [uncultured Oscillibacter sp.]|uniref:DIP1984 family protein n=1 Tax=uncultured Oscillibacter sp. TaxID=876091 RepID=UPI002625F2C3|nr:DIP1984 family protein [uncultured Oscillibacter sp.]